MMQERRPILLVTGDAESRMALYRMLQVRFQVLTATGESEARRIAREHPIQAVLADQRLPESSGLDLVRSLHQEWPELGAVLLVTYPDLKAVLDASERVRPFRHLLKPCEPAELIRVLADACLSYETAVEQRELLATVQRYQAECLSLLEGLHGGRLGALNLPGHLKVMDLLAFGAELSDCLTRIGSAHQSGAADCAVTAAPSSHLTPVPGRCYPGSCDADDTPAFSPRVEDAGSVFLAGHARADRRDPGHGGLRPRDPSPRGSATVVAHRA